MTCTQPPQLAPHEPTHRRHRPIFDLFRFILPRRRTTSRQRWSPSCLCLGLLLLFLGWTRPAAASAYDVGMGFAGGLAYSPTKLQQGNLARAGNSFIWGFFVDIPLLETFYVAPAAVIYKLNLGAGSRPATDIDLNFKFIVPMGLFRLGAGLTFGLTATDVYDPHAGVLGYASLSLGRNIDAFTLLQYKRLMRDVQQIDNVHGFLGLMFRF